MKYYDVIVVGSGVSGISALIWLKQLGIKAIMLEKSHSIGGQLHKVHNKIIDYPGFFGVDGKGLSKKLNEHLLEMDCEWRTGIEVLNINIVNKKVLLTVFNAALMEYEVYSANYLIMAAGARESRLGIPGEEKLLSNFGVLSTTEKPEIFEDKKVVIVGGGNRALEGAYRLANIARSITIVHRNDRFKGKNEYVKFLLNHTSITFKTFCQLRSVVWDDKLEGVVIKNNHTGKEEYQEVDYVLIRIGISANSSLLQHLIESENGYVKTDRWGKTSINQIYAVGDLCTPPEYSSISLYAGQGMAAAKSIWLSMMDERENSEEEKFPQKNMKYLFG